MTMCDQEIFGPKETSFKFYKQRFDETGNRTEVLVIDVRDLFNKPNIPSCEIRQWYISGLSSTAQLPDMDPIAIQFNQVDRTALLGSLSVNQNLISATQDVTFDFRI